MPTKYELTEEAKVSPQEIPVFGGGRMRMVAVGGPIVIPAKPPKASRKIPEANQKELAELFRRGYTHLVREAKKKE